MKSKIIFFLSLIFGFLAVTPRSFSQDPLQAENNIFFAHQTALDILNHGSGYYGNFYDNDYFSFGREGAKLPRCGFDWHFSDPNVSLVMKASEFISYRVGQMMLEDVTTLRVGPTAAIANSEGIIQSLEHIQNQHLPRLGGNLHNIQNFFTYPQIPEMYRAFRQHVLALKNDVVLPLLNYDFRLQNPQISALEIRNLEPLLNFLNIAENLILEVEANEMELSDEMVSEVEKLKKEFERFAGQKVGGIQQFVTSFQEISNRILAKYSVLKAAHPTPMTNEAAKTEIEAFETSFYTAFQEAVVEFGLNTKNKQEVLRAFSKINLSAGRSQSPNILSNNNVNRSGLSPTDLIQRVGFRYLETILRQRLNYMAETSEGRFIVGEALRNKMIRDNRALVLQIGIREGKGLNPLVDRARSVREFGGITGEDPARTRMREVYLKIPKVP